MPEITPELIWNIITTFLMLFGELLALLLVFFGVLPTVVYAFITFFFALTSKCVCNNTDMLLSLSFLCRRCFKELAIGIVVH